MRCRISTRCDVKGCGETVAFRLVRAGVSPIGCRQDQKRDLCVKHMIEFEQRVHEANTAGEWAVFIAGGS